MKIDNFSFSKNSVLKVIATLTLICAFWEFLIMLFLNKLYLLSPIQLVLLDTLLLSFFISTSFWFVYFRPKWKKDRTEQSFVEQQIKGLNQVAIISTTDREGNIVYVNDNFCRISGYSRDSLLGQKYQLIRASDYSRSFFENLWETITSGQIWQGQIKNVNKYGQNYWVDTSIVPLVNEETREIDEFISISFDKTKEKKLEGQLEDEQAINIHMGRLAALGEMAGSVAHEINNPIAIVLGNIHILRRTIEKIENQEIKEAILKNITVVDEQSKRITRIVKGLREFSHRGEIENLEEFSVTELLDSVLKLCAEKINHNEIEIKNKVSELNIVSSKIQLEQVLVNLINNSIDAIDSLEKKWIEFSSFEKNEMIYFSITDSGPGIAPHLAKKIMQPFFTTKQVGEGTGLGLSISKGLIEKLAGEFLYDSNSKNTRFVIKLPKNEAAIFKSLDFVESINAISELKKKIERHLEKKSDNLSELDLIHGDATSPLAIWLNHVGLRMTKNEDFLTLKGAHQDFAKLSADVAVKIQNNRNENSGDFLILRDKFNDATNQLIDNLIRLERKYPIN